MAMSGADGRVFSLDSNSNLGSRPMGAFLNSQRWLPPVIAVAGVTLVAYLLVERMRRK